MEHYMDYKKIIDTLTKYTDEGVQIVDDMGVTIVYNDKMASLEETNRLDILGAHFEMAYPGFPKENSTLLKALKTGKSTVSQKQAYYNKAGKTINTINTTIPVKSNGKIVAAIEIARDVTSLTEMSQKIVDYQMKKAEDIAEGNAHIPKYTFDDLVGEDSEFKACIENAKLISENSFSVMIYGETGTGKELFSQSIHYNSDRKNKPFLAQNCAALPEELLEGILFGTTKGGFTGAVDRPGLFEQASGGTLLLDEISAMPYALQSKLLRVLQEKYIRRVGGDKDIPVDVRIIATANESIEDLIRRGRFRKDLYYRLGIITLNLVPLRERSGDIPLLAEAFIEKHRKDINPEVTGISEEARLKLMSHDFPGNVRELENVIIAAMASANGEDTIKAEHLNFILKNDKKEDGGNYCLDGCSLPQKMENIERSIIEETLQECGGNISHAAAKMGIVRQNLQHKMKKYGIR